MPKTSITHEPWYAEHIGAEVGVSETCCTRSAYFGPPMPERVGDIHVENDTRGSLFVQFAEDEPEAVATLEVAPHSGCIDLTALRAVRAALADDPKGFLYAIDKTLSAVDAEVSV
jgi:hypothetical protein